MVQHLVEPLPVDLDPAPLEAHEVVRRGKNLLPLGVGDRLSVERESRLERHQGVDAHRGPAVLAEFEVDLDPGRPAALPPVGDFHDDASLFKRLCLLNELQGFGCPPGEGGENALGVEQLGRELALLGVLPERSAEGQVLKGATRRHAVGVGGEEREGKELAALVLGEVERHASDHAPEGVDGAEPTLDRAGVGRDVGVELAPQLRKERGAYVLRAGRGRRRGGESRELFVGGGRRGFVLVARALAQGRQVLTGEGLPVGQGRSQELFPGQVGRQGDQAGRGRLAKRLGDFPGELKALGVLDPKHEAAGGEDVEVVGLVQSFTVGTVS